MSRTAKVNFPWADGDYDFTLRIAELEELEVLSNKDEPAARVGPGYMLGQLALGPYGNWKARWVREIIRLGLIGGGQPPKDALRLVRLYVDDRPLGENLQAAQAVLTAAVVGGDEEPPGEIPGEPPTSSPSDGSPSATSIPGAGS